MPKAPLGVAADATDDDVAAGGDAVSDEEHPATREIPAKPMQAFNAAIRAVVAIQEFNTRLVKTNSGGRATFLGNERRGAFLVGQAGKSFDTVSDGNQGGERMTANTVTGKNVLIAGGAKNLGGLISRDLAAQGARAVAVHYNSESTRSAAEETASAVSAAGATAQLFQADLTSPAAVKKLFDDAEEGLGSIDIAINTTGMVIKKPFPEITEEDYDKIFAINAKTAFFFIQQAGARLSDRGKIVTLVTSLLSAFTVLYSIYAGSKAPVEHFTRAASKEFGERGISVNAVAPGPMETPFFYGQETKESADYNQNAADLSKFTETGLTDPRDIVPLVRFLVSDGWWITGQTILANGGYTTR